ncbi:hypothetical protein [Bullifex sp.]|uniref:hypothetical protein n=1 Tax=Bullifex sp. TaxID=2815808 RepID=UPI002A83D64F|nr:hypothetical protein [Bullifex sp.]MDY4068023.1 hypothetical protein [Bullifex sp.]
MEKKDTRDIILLTVLSFILSCFSVGSLVFTFPLLLLSKRYPKKITDTACVAVMVLAAGKQLYTSRDVLMNSLTYFFVGNNLFIPFALILGAMVWMHTKGEDVVKRLIYTIVPTLVLFILFAVVYTISPQSAQGVLSTYREIFVALFSEIFQLSSEALNTMFDMVLEMMLSLVIPLVFINIVVVHYLYEASKNGNDVNFDKKIINFSLPYSFIYAFLGLWTIMLLKRFVSIPMSVNVIVNNLALLVTLFYGMQGFSIILYNLRRKGSTLSGTRMMGFLILSMILLPGINAILVLALVGVGVVNTWIELRKPFKESLI